MPRNLILIEDRDLLLQQLPQVGYMRPGRRSESQARALTEVAVLHNGHVHVLGLLEELPKAIAAAEYGLDLCGWYFHQAYIGLVRYGRRPSYLQLALTTSVTGAPFAPCSLLPCVPQPNKLKLSVVRSD